MKNPFMPQLPVPLEDIPVEARVTPTPSPVIQSIENTDVVPEPEIPDPDYTVNGLVWNTPRPQAILDDEIVNLGDQLGIWTITAISREGVTLSYESKSVVLAPSVK